MTKAVLLDSLAAQDANPALSQLLSRESSSRLQQIASLRARGIGDHVDLPQLIVCGDQSAGKSSVLDALTGIPFPRQDGLCTKFPTEIILEHSEGHSEGHLTLTASIIPSAIRDEKNKASLLRFKHQLKNFDDLPQTIAAVGELMGIRGFGGIDSGPAFAEDVLRIRVSGQTGLNLTVVDLPGLITVHSDDQTEDDPKLVHRMVDSYAANPRAVILAVVQAGNDISNQIIIQKSREFDQAGARTIGIITKPDLINEASVKRISLLAKNQDSTKLKLGFFLLKNPDPNEMAKGITTEQRKSRELEFFKSSPWKEQNLRADRVGVDSLRVFLKSILDQHVERELPKVREEIRNLIKEKEEQILEMGEERPTVAHLRTYLSRLSMDFHGLISAGLNGDYHERDAAFFDDEQVTANPLRLRALVHRLNTEFSDNMRRNGAKRKVVESDFEIGDPSEDEKGQLEITQAKMTDWVKETYHNSRGKELPGNYNHILLSELFHVQSIRWLRIAEDHVENVYDQTASFIKAALRYVAKDDLVFGKILEAVESSMAQSRIAAMKELKKLWDDERQQPITYNHYYTDNVQNSRKDAAQNAVKDAINRTRIEEYEGKMHISNTVLDVTKFHASVQKRVIVNMDDQACAEALEGLMAYYKVARKTFVDNVCKQVIERHLLRTLPSIFCPERVAGLSDEELQRIATEAPENIEKRKALRALHESLKSSYEDLRR